MWKIEHIITGEVKEWSIWPGGPGYQGKLFERDRDKREDKLLEPEALLASGEWKDIADGWSHTQGTVIEIAHGNNLNTIYYHTIPSVSPGTFVNKGDELGVTTNNGWSSGTHLHYTLEFNYRGREYRINPLAPPPEIRYLLLGDICVK
jgi:hypothetical protein